MLRESNIATRIARMKTDSDAAQNKTHLIAKRAQRLRKAD